MKPKMDAEVKTDEDEDDDRIESVEDRAKDYSDIKSVRKQLHKIYDAVVKGFEDKRDQNDSIDECWDIYHCQLNEHQSYTGSAKIYVPIVRDAIAARETRFINMLFPQTGRYAEVVTNDGRVPYEETALLDYYVRQARLRDVVMPGLIRTGDITGQYSLYVDWVETKRHIVSKRRTSEHEVAFNASVEGSPEFDDIEYDEVVDARPRVSVLDPRNLLILPTSVDTIDEAEIVCVVLRLTEAKIHKYVKNGVFEKGTAEELIENMSQYANKQQPNTEKKAAEAAGVKTDSKGNKTALVYQVWSKLKVKGEYRSMVIHFAGQDLILGCKRNPYWCDRVPVITQAVEKNPDTIWGNSQVEPVKMLQYQANDAANMGFDSAKYALLPIVMTDPEKNPNYGSLVLEMASVWTVDPNTTKFAAFPALWKDAMTMVASCKDQILQSLGVNPAMLPHGNAGKKPSQAQIAQEQQIALESSADNVALVQEGVLSKLLEWFYELDYQYRDRDVTVKKFGQLGLQADMQQVQPFQVRERLEFKWYGTEGFKATQQVQQMISWANVLRGLPPQLLNGRKVDIGPVAEYISEVTFGPRLAPHVLIDERHQLTMSSQLENQLMEQGFPVQVHEMDNDMQHIQDHYTHFQQLLAAPPMVQEMNPVAVQARGHILEHIKAAKAKAAAAQGAQPGMMGAPSQPQMGAGAQMPTGPQQPPGAVSPDAMPMAMPRKGM